MGSEEERTDAAVEPRPEAEGAVAPDPGSAPALDDRPRRPPNMLPGREGRRFKLERLLVRLIATGGIVAIGVALGAILAASKVHGWIMGLVIAGVTVLLSALLWSSRQL